MEQTSAFKNKILNFEKALDSFGKLLDYDLSLFDEIVKDGLKNGRIQKFEYCSEICWKLIKKFLLLKDGIDANSPKEVIKEFYNASYIPESEFELLVNMIDDRNRLGHLYKEEYFNEISQNLPKYYDSMKTVFEIINNSVKD